MRLVVGCLAIVSAAACTEAVNSVAQPPIPVSCTMNEIAGIVLFIVDSTDGPFRAPVTTTLRDGPFSQTIAFPATYGLDHRYLAYERAGTYSITASGLTSGNYTISYQPGTLTVARRSITVAASNDSKTYDGLGYSGGNLQSGHSCHRPIG